MNQGPVTTDDSKAIEPIIGGYTYQYNITKVCSIIDVLLNKVMPEIKEKFANVYILFYYLSIQMKLQMKDAQIRTSVTNTHEKILIINFNLHLKGSQDEYLYGIIIMDGIIETQYKGLWQIDQFLSAEEIKAKYKLEASSYSLPAPSQISYFEKAVNKRDMDEYIENCDYEQWVDSDGQSGCKLVMDRSEWINAFKDNDDKWTPVVLNDNNELQMAHIKIIHIISQDAYVGVQMKQSVLPEELRQMLPEDIALCIQSYTTILSIISDPKFISYASAAASLSRSISLAEMVQYTKKWVNNAKICDLNKELTNIADKHDVEPDHVIECFSNGVTRQSFSIAMTQHRIKRGKALKIYNNIDKSGLISSANRNDNMLSINDFSDDWAKVLKEQHEYQQEIIGHLKISSQQISQQL